MREVINKLEATEELDRFYGKGKWATPTNFFYRDYVYAHSLKEKYGMDITDLAKKIGYDAD